MWNCILLFVVFLAGSECQVTNTLIPDQPGDWYTKLTLYHGAVARKELTTSVVIPIGELIPPEVDSDVAYALEYDPHPDLGFVHHYVLQSCVDPSYENPHLEGDFAPHPWYQGQYPECFNQSFMYGWGDGGEKVVYPPGVAFFIDQTVQNLIFQIHFAKDKPDGVPDTSYLNILMTKHKPPRKAQVFMMDRYPFQLPPGEIGMIHSNCEVRFQMDILSSFSHAHKIIDDMWGFIIKRKTGKITEVSHRSPLVLQSFHKIEKVKEAKLSPGDRLAAACRYDTTNRTTVTSRGMTYEDEMCSWYVMVAVDADSKFDGERCMSEEDKKLSTYIEAEIDGNSLGPYPLSKSANNVPMQVYIYILFYFVVFW